METQRDDELDGKLIGALRALYAAPADALYWTASERRILAAALRAGALSTDAWWSVLGQWARLGLAAAAVLLALAGALWSRLDQRDLRGTYESFTQPMIADAVPGAAQLLDLPHDGTAREATLNYVLSH